MSTGSGRVTMDTLTNNLKDQDGVIMLELVFAMSILVAIFLATFTFAFLYGDYYGVQKVAAEGAREASITKDTGWARTKAMQSAWLWGLDPSKTTVEFYTGSGDVTCTVHYVASPFSKTFPKLLEGSPLKDEVHVNTRVTYAFSDTR